MVDGAKVMADELAEGRREVEEGVVEAQPAERFSDRAAADDREDTDNDACVEDGAR
jgi:hypothetical protein